MEIRGLKDPKDPDDQEKMVSPSSDRSQAEDTGMTVEQVFRFSFKNGIPILQTLTKDIGYITICDPDGAFVREFNPKIKATIPKNLMKGDDVCIERFIWEG
jgi:hypothetical protein